MEARVQLASRCHCERRLVGCRPFIGPPTWHSVCRDGLLKFNVPRVSDTLDVQSGRLTGLAAWVVMCGVVRFEEQATGISFLREGTDLDWAMFCWLTEGRGNALRCSLDEVYARRLRLLALEDIGKPAIAFLVIPPAQVA